ncbi:MAG: pilus assembly protein [Planctomycetaceae bacterium]|nr:pilus assembly protein [Planctomycetaceae bacterium]
MRPTINRRRRGVTTVEFAIVCPIAFFLIFATIVGGLGVFRYQQVAGLAREGARWASVHGGLYEQETGNPAATPADVYNQAILPRATALDPNHITYSVTWDQNNFPLWVDEDVAHPTGNTVTVTVNYEWFPEMYLIGPYTLTSTSEVQMYY